MRRCHLGVIATFVAVMSLSPRAFYATDLSQTDLSGVVVDADTSSPIADAAVRLLPSGGSTATTQQVLTGTDGRFLFRSVPAGRYSVSASKTGFRGGRFGQRSPRDGSVTLVLPTSRNLGAITLSMWSLGEISGRVIVPAGARLQRIEVLAFSVSKGGQVFEQVRSTPADPAGRYRIQSLLAGRYVIAAKVVTTEAGRQASHTTYFPAGSSIGLARTLELAAGSQADDVNIQTEPTTAVLRIAGRLVGNRSPNPAVVELVQLPEVVGVPPSQTTVPDPSGVFSFAQVAAGTYLLRTIIFPKWDVTEGARVGNDTPLPSKGSRIAATPTGPTLWGELPVQAHVTDVLGLELPLRNGHRVSGRVVFDKTPRVIVDPRPSSAVYIEPGSRGGLGNFPVAAIGQDGSFASVPLPPGRYAVGLLSPPQLRLEDGWFVAAIQRQGKSIAGRYFELVGDVDDIVITLSSRYTVLTGKVQGDFQLVDDVRILAFPQDPANRRELVATGAFGRAPELVIQTRPDSEGNFTITGLLPGKYSLIAVSGGIPDDWLTERYLTAAETAGSAKIELTAGATQSVMLAPRRVR